MSLEKMTVVDLVEVTRNGHIQVRKATLILEDGVEIGKTYHRHVISPGDDFSQEDEKVKKIVQVVQTKDVVSEYRAKIKEQEKV